MTLADQLVVLNGGVIEQAGPPLEVYARPKTRFVAAFLGMPPMNFVDATLRREGDVVRAHGPGLEVEISAARLGARETREITVGIRPQDVRVTERAPAPIDMRFELVEGLGFEAHVHGKLGELGPAFVARLEGEEGQRIPKRGQLALDVAPKDVHVFDRETGRALVE
jgi:sn-glycerol 3-phosphate transport system ATP-binding protein/multiple sugar transport system ATP-binding protein